jgi:DNA-binding LacI/PurR family transcriptional regulator
LRKRISCGGIEIVTVKDVAKQAGVSISTVSHVVNSTRFVSDDLKKRVQSAMKELDYKPNHIARSLRRKKTKSLGLLISDITNPFFSEIAWSIEELSFFNEYSLFLCSTNGDGAKETF